MTRRTRRRLFVLATSALIGGTVPFWAPRILARLPAFQVQHVGVVGTRYVAPDEVVRLAALEPDASVWDDPGPVEARLESHPLIRQARVRRDGLRQLEVRVVEARPVALAAVPELVPVDAEGRRLPLDPAETALDLPLLPGPLALEDGRLTAPGALRLARLLGELDAYDPALAQKVSEVRWTPDGAVEVRLLPGSHTDRILLPAAEPMRALRRVELALGEAAPAEVAVADARFREQVVLRPPEGAGPRPWEAATLPGGGP